jgi:Na+/H+ antiporter NhaA
VWGVKEMEACGGLIIIVAAATASLHLAHYFLQSLTEDFTDLPIAMQAQDTQISTLILASALPLPAVLAAGGFVIAI